MIEQARADELFRKYRQTGDVNIRNELVENYLYIAEILAKKFSGRGVEYDDLLQIASEGLISGVEKYDPDNGAQFTTYITPTITGNIKNYFRDYSRAVRLPRRVYALSVKVKRATADYFQKYGQKPTVKQLSKELGVPEEDVLEALEYRAPVSLDSPVNTEDGEGALLYDVIPDSTDNFEGFEITESLRSEIQKLDPTEREVVTLRFVDGYSQSEVGKMLGVSQMFVSRAERKILKKLRESLI